MRHVSFRCRTLFGVATMTWKWSCPQRWRRCRFAIFFTDQTKTTDRWRPDPVIANALNWAPSIGDGARDFSLFFPFLFFFVPFSFASRSKSGDGNGYRLAYEVALRRTTRRWRKGKQRDSIRMRNFRRSFQVETVHFVFLAAYHRWKLRNWLKVRNMKYQRTNHGESQLGPFRANKNDRFYCWVFIFFPLPPQRLAWTTLFTVLPEKMASHSRNRRFVKRSTGQPRN